MSTSRSGSWFRQSVLGVAGGALALTGPAMAHADVASLDFAAAAEQQDRPYFADAEPVSLFDEDGTPRQTSVLRFADANGANQNAANDVIEEEPAVFADDAGNDRITFGPFALYERNNIYTRGSLGLSVSSESVLDPGVAFNAAGGYAWRMIRFEGDLGFRYHNVDGSGFDGDFYTLAFMVNGLVDFDVVPVEGLDLYAGLGLGLVYGSIDIDVDTVTFVPGVGVVSTTRSVDDSSTDFGVQWMFGADYNVTDQFSVFGGYRLLTVNTTRIGSTQFHTLEGGVQFIF